MSGEREPRQRRVRERLAAFDREVLTPGDARSAEDRRRRYAPLADTFRLPLVGGAGLAALLTVLELGLVRRPLGTVAFLVAGVVVGALVGLLQARGTAERYAVVPPLEGDAVRVPHRTPPRLLALLGLVAGLLCLLPLLLDFPTPVGPFAAAVAVQAFLERRAVLADEARSGGRLVVPAARLAVGDDAVRRDLDAPSA